MKKLLLILILITGCMQTPSIETAPAIPQPTPPSQETIQHCHNFCSGDKHATNFKVDYDDICYCYDKNDNLIINATDFEDDDRLKWKHMPINYTITNKEECGDYEVRKIQRAFKQIQEATNNTVRFQEINHEADIDITCTFIEDCYEHKIDIRRDEGITYEYESICEHAKGIATIKETRANSILKAEIVMIGLAGFAETDNRGASGFYIGSCGHTTTELHEILHTFNFKHKPNPDSIMYFQEDSVAHTLQKKGACIGSIKEIDKDIIEELIDIYSK